MLASRDLGLMPYRDAWAVQEELHARVADGLEPPTVLLVEHPPVITFGRRAEVSASHVLESRESLARMGVEVVESDRGGDVTFHGPGQLVAYPIIRLADHRLSVGGYVRKLQDAVVSLCGSLGLHAELDPSAVGIWTPTQRGLAKVCAVGVRVKRGTTLHGLALNLTTDLRYFDLIVPCGLAGRPVTSLSQLLGPHAPDMTTLKSLLVNELASALLPR